MSNTIVYNQRGSRQMTPYNFCFLTTLSMLINLMFLSECTARPHIEEINKHRYLSVNSKPFIALSIEDHRTTGFDGAVREEYFKIAKQLCANAITVTFRWNYFEKKEAQYDTATLRNIKNTADKYGLKIVILWFGSNISGHGNSGPDFVLGDSITYIPYTRSDKSFATRISGLRTDRIYCYSFDNKHINMLLLKEQEALQALIYWIKTNDPEQTFIMLQLENELYVHPELWRPWPAVKLPLAKLSRKKTVHSWDSTFQVQACSLRITTVGKMQKNRRVDFFLSDTTGKRYWNGSIETAGTHELRIGGEYINEKCQMMVRSHVSNTDTIDIYDTSLWPIAERCHCWRCNEMYTTGNYQSDQDFQQDVFISYINSLASAIAEIDAHFPLYLNLFINYDAKTRLGNPYYNPQRWLNSISDIDFIAPDIYFESKVPVIDSFLFDRNVVFIPESGHLTESKDSSFFNAFSLIFPILGVYQGIGIQIYDLKSPSTGLISIEGQWKETAYLVRNSYCAISQLPADLFYKGNKTIGFRNVVKENFILDDLSISIEPISAPKYARGIIVKTDSALIFCGIGFKATISNGSTNIKIQNIERGYWKDNKYISLGPPKTGTLEIDKEGAKIMMGEDDLSPSDTFDPLNNQYCIKIIYD